MSTDPTSRPSRQTSGRPSLPRSRSKRRSPTWHPRRLGTEFQNLTPRPCRAADHLDVSTRRKVLSKPPVAFFQDVMPVVGQRPDAEIHDAEPEDVLDRHIAGGQV